MRAVTNISKGYTKALANTAPVEPATARPHGGSGAGFDCTGMMSEDGLGYSTARAAVLITSFVY